MHEELEKLLEQTEKQSEKIICIDGNSGAGKGTLTEHLCDKFGYKHLSAGKMFRKIAKEKNMTVGELSEKADKQTDIEIDKRTIKEAFKQDCIVDSRIGSRILGDYADLKIRLEADLEERARRVAERENLEIEVAKKRVEKRDEDNEKRYKEYYNIDMNNLETYDLIVDNTKLEISHQHELVEKALKMWFKNV